MREITRKDFIDAFTRRDTTDAMPTDELCMRLDITLNALKEAQANDDKRLATVAVNCLRGALIRLSQAYGDPQVETKVQELISITTNIIGI
jgi:hypothetical protein